MVLLSQIDQVKVRAEGAHELEQALCRLLLCPFKQSLVKAVARPKLNRGKPGVLNIGEQLGAALFAEHLAYQLAE